MEITLKKANPDGDMPVPEYKTDGSSGMDLCADITETLHLKPGYRTLVPTGMHISLPHGYEGQVRPRSGMALKHGVTVLNSPGTLDQDYTGEIGVILVNHGSQDFQIERFMRVAQLVIVPVVQAKITVMDELPETERGAGGFGSTGTHS